MNAKRIKMRKTRVDELQRRRRRNAELLLIQIHDHWTPSSSSTDPEPKRTKTTTVADTENSADKMDVDSAKRTPVTSHPLEPDAHENSCRR